MTTTRHLTPRSILRHRPLPASAISPLPEIVPWIKRASRTVPRPLTVSAQSKTPCQNHTTSAPPSSWVVTIGISMCLTLLLILVSQPIIIWSTTLSNNLVYGTPRTYQVDAFVGHEGVSKQTSHFIALNNHGQIEVIELPANDAAQARVFLGPFLTGPNASQVPVTLTFPDPHHTGRPDMLLHIQNTTIRFLNLHNTFQQEGV